MSKPYEFRFTSTDGLRIACSRWESRGPSRGVIQIAHGLGERSGRYSELIALLQQANFVVYANDHRGHGRTDACPEQLGDFGSGGFDLLVEDMAMKERSCGRPTLDICRSGRSSSAQSDELPDWQHNGISTRNS